jgi:hypothetical protein
VIGGLCGEGKATMTRLATMIVGAVVALGMGALLLVWLGMNEGSGIVGFLFIAGVVVGLVMLLIGVSGTREK